VGICSIRRKGILGDCQDFTDYMGRGINAFSVAWPGMPGESTPSAISGGSVLDCLCMKAHAQNPNIR
jgi:hypothetical protein